MTKFRAKPESQQETTEVAEVIHVFQDWTPAPEAWNGVVVSSFGEEPKAPLPEKIKITHLHGFIDDNGRHRQWHGNDIVSEPNEIAMLIGRGARFEVI